MISGSVLTQDELTQLSAIFTRKSEKLIKYLLRPLYKSIVFIANNQIYNAVPSPGNSVKTNSFTNKHNNIEDVFETIIDSFYQFSTKFFEGDNDIENGTNNPKAVVISTSMERIYYWYFNDSDADDRYNERRKSNLNVKELNKSRKIYLQGNRIKELSIIQLDRYSYKSLFPRIGSIF